MFILCYVLFFEKINCKENLFVRQFSLESHNSFFQDDAEIAFPQNFYAFLCLKKYFRHFLLESCNILSDNTRKNCEIKNTLKLNRCKVRRELTCGKAQLQRTSQISRRHPFLGKSRVVRNTLEGIQPWAARNYLGVFPGLKCLTENYTDGRFLPKSFTHTKIIDYDNAVAAMVDT